MNAPFATFLRASSPYWFRTDSEAKPGVLYRISSDLTSKLGFQKIQARDIVNFGVEATSSGSLDCFIDEDTIAIAVHRTFFSLRADDLEQLLRSFSRANAQAFRSSTKSVLIRALAQRTEGNTTNNLLAAFCDYTHFYSCSAWLYNNITDVFTCIAGSVDRGSAHLTRQDCPILSEALERSEIIVRTVDPSSWSPDKVSQEVRWCNVFCVKTNRSTYGDDSFDVILCFYSRYDQYNLRPDTVSLIRSFIQQDLTDRYFDRLAEMNKLRASLQELKSPDKPLEFLEDACKKICLRLSWESCSIFLMDPITSGVLYQVAPKTLKRVEYMISSDSMTATVYRERKMLWSYDISADKRNTHRSDDITTSQPRDWIGVPIVAYNREPYGVIRVKNRCAAANSFDVYFNNLDMRNLQAIAAEVAGVLHQCQAFTERKKIAEERAMELHDLQDFLRTFRHEIRSPIQAVCFAPERLGLILTQTGLVDPANIPRKLRDFLVDFKATGQRLEMISKALTLDPDKIVKHISINNLYKDCVAPVMTFMVPYANKQGRRVTVDKDSLLVNIECDPLAITIAFHVLVDNALKYSDRGSLIRVYGEHSGGGPQVVVESRSSIFFINDDEVDKIKEKYFRGRVADQQKLDGSGIGLYLADRIMKAHGGQLVLLRQRDPVRFALRFSNEAIS